MKSNFLKSIAPIVERNNSQDEEGKVQSVQSVEEFVQRFNELFTRTISEEDKEEKDFASEYAELVEVLREFIARSKASGAWS